jgi:hypothetical protein
VHKLREVFWNGHIGQEFHIHETILKIFYTSSQIILRSSWCERLTRRKGRNTVELNCNNLGLYDTSSIASHIPWYQLNLHKACLSPLLIKNHLSRILPIIRSNIIFKNTGYFEHSTISRSLRGQALYAFR